MSKYKSQNINNLQENEQKIQKIKDAKLEQLLSVHDRIESITFIVVKN